MNIFRRIVTLMIFCLTVSGLFAQPKAEISLSCTENDTAKIITASVTKSPVRISPAADVTIYFYVKRLFGMLPIGDAMTDENGKASIIFPKNLPGDENGNVTVIAKIEDDEIYGNVETKSVMKIGVPVPIKNNSFPRALWSPRAPMGLIVVFLILIGGVWITYAYVTYLLYKIKKSGSPISPAD